MFPYKLSIQTVLPDNYLKDPEFKMQMTTLQENGFWGVELNIADPLAANLDQIKEFLSTFDLKLSMYASGLTAKVFSLSLSSTDETNRQNAVQKIKEIADAIDSPDIGIILGFFKGAKSYKPEETKAQFRKSLNELAPYVTEKQVPLLIEATNRYESSIANSLEETAGFVKDYNSKYLQILPDTYHMNIEESDLYEALDRYSKYYTSIHLSDNNRLFPGFGAIDFSAILNHLKKSGFTGRLAIEGNIKKDFHSDTRKSVEYLKSIIS